MSRIACCVLLLGYALAARAGESTALEYPASASIDVDATGKAHVVTLASSDGENGAPVTAISELVEARLRERIESWQFVPATRDGLPVPSRTHLSVELRAKDDGQGGLSVQVVSARTGPSLRNHRLDGVIGELVASGMYVVADMRYGADGRVVDVDVTDQRILSGARFVPYTDRNLKKAVERSLKRWTFEPEVVAGQPIAGGGRLPIRICMSALCMAASVDGGEDREFAATDPAVKLRDDVAGTML